MQKVDCSVAPLPCGVILLTINVASGVGIDAIVATPSKDE